MCEVQANDQLTDSRRARRRNEGAPQPSTRRNAEAKEGRLFGAAHG